MTEPIHALADSIPPTPQYLLRETVLQHGRATRVLPATGLAVALAVVAVLWDGSAHSVLGWWFTAVAVATALHALVYRRLAAQIETSPTNRRWLWVHRACIMVQGCAWGAASGLLEVLPEGLLHQVVIFAVLVMVAGTVVAGAFDLVSAMLFAVPAGTPMVVHFALHDGSGSAIALMALTIAIFVFAAFQNHRGFRGTVVRRRERALRQREEEQRAWHLRQATALAGVASWDYDPSTQTVDFPADVARAIGMGRGGSEALELVLARMQPDSVKRLTQAIDETLRTGRPMSLEIDVKPGEDVSRAQVLLLSAGAVVENGKVVRLTGTMQDLTAIRRREREFADEARLRQQLLENTEQGIWFLDNDGMTTDVNAAMCGLLGRPRRAVLGRSVFDFFADADLAELHRQLELRRQGHKLGYEIGINRPDGTRVECFNNATPLYDSLGAKVGSVGMWTDLTPIKRAATALRQREEELSAVLSAMPGYIVVLDERLRISYLNQRTAQAIGQSPQEVLGRTLEETMGRRTAATIQEHWAGLRTPGATRIDEEVHHVGADRQQRLVLETTRLAGPVEAGGRQRLYAFGIDITERKRAQEALALREAELRSTLDNFPGPVAMVDSTMRYRYVNPQQTRLVGRSAQELIGRTLVEVLGEQRGAELAQVRDRLDQGEQIVQERTFGPGQSLPEGSVLRFVRVAGPPAADGTRNYFSFGMDITENRQAEARISAALRAAEAASRAKSEFLSQVSHELRTPLNAILGFAQLLETDREYPLAPAQHLKVQEMLSGAQHLLDLINGLLDLGRIESGNFSLALRPVAVAPLLGEALKLMAPLADPHGIELVDKTTGFGHLQVMADATRLRQVVLNLLGNAVKYNQPRGRVTVACHASADRVVVEVVDSGLGLTTDEQRRLFEPFQRLRAEGSGVEGTGIGLALSRRLAEAMKGHIGVDSQPGQGSTFWVDLPRAPDRQATASQSEGVAPLGPEWAPTPGAEPSKVLYIDDNPVNVLVMQAMLSRLPGLTVLTADDGEPGLALALQKKPALILTDIQMPGMDGFELLRRLREQPETSDIPVVAISADALPDTLARGRIAGFADYLTKPVQMSALHEVVGRLINPSPVRH